MIANTRLPGNLITVIGSENKDFAVKAGRAQPRRNSYALIIFGAFWTAFTSIFVVAFMGPLFRGNEVHFEANGVPTIASPDNLEPILFPALIIGLFVLIGIAMLAGDIELRGDTIAGSISLQMRTGRMVSKKNGPDRYVPDVIHITKIPYVFEIEKICRRRIKENDPTPALR